MLFIGFLSGNVIKGVAFILTIMPLRQNAGGFHFKSKRVCVVVSLLIYIIYMLIIRNIFIGEGVQIIIYIVASIAIIMFSPVDSDNNRLDEIEIKTYRYRTAIVWLSESMFFVIMLLIEKTYWSFIISFSMGITAFLQMIQLLNENIGRRY